MVIEEGKTTNVKLDIGPTFGKLVQQHPDWSKHEQFQFQWTDPSGEQGGNKHDIHDTRSKLITYTFSRGQAVVVQRLFERGFSGKKADVKETDLLTLANKQAIKQKHKTLSALFNNSKHPAWKTMIVAGKTKGTWRLQEPGDKKPAVKPEGSIQFKFLGLKKTTDLKNVAIKFGLFPIHSKPINPNENPFLIPDQKPMPKGEWGFADRFLTRGEIKLPVGTYDIKVAMKNNSKKNDWWLTGMVNRQYHHSQVIVRRGEKTEVSIDFDSQALMKIQPDWSKHEQFKFQWQNPSGETEIKQGIMKVKTVNHTFTRQQAVVVQKLLEIAFSERMSEVKEDILLKVANAYAEKETFGSLITIFNNGKHPAWKTIIVAGKTKGHWMLKIPEIKYPQKGVKPEKPVKKKIPMIDASLQPVIDASLQPAK